MKGNPNLSAGDVQTFSVVVSTGSFSEAAKRLGITRSAVSKSITRLEQHLGVVLLHRSTRKLSLTDAGRHFNRYATEIDAALQKAEAAVANYDQDVVGTLSVSLPTSFGAALLPRIVGKFRPRWPELTLSLDFNDAYVDIIGGGVDLAIRIAPHLENSNLKSKRLATSRIVLVASPGYLEKNGTPKHFLDLMQHRCIHIGSASRTPEAWRFREGREIVETPVTSSLTATSHLPLILAACLDEGILQIPELLVGGEIASKRLVEILPEFSDSREWGVFAVYPSRILPAKVQAFIEFVEEEMPALASVNRWDPFANGSDRESVDS